MLYIAILVFVVTAVGIFIALSLLGKVFSESRPDHAEIAKNWSKRPAS